MIPTATWPFKNHENITEMQLANINLGGHGTLPKLLHLQILAMRTNYPSIMVEFHLCDMAEIFDIKLHLKAHTL